MQREVRDECVPIAVPLANFSIVLAQSSEINTYCPGAASSEHIQLGTAYDSERPLILWIPPDWIPPVHVAEVAQVTLKKHEVVPTPPLPVTIIVLRFHF